MKNKLKLILSILGIWVFVFTDFLLNIREMFGSGFYESFYNMDYRIILFSTLGIFAFPLVAIGLKKILLECNLENINPFMFGFISTVPVFMHTSFYYYYHVVNTIEDTENMLNLINKFDNLKDIFGKLYFIGLGLISLAILIQIFRNKSIYPRYFGFINPVFGLILINLIKVIAPSIAAFIYPIFVPATMLGFMMTLYLTYSYKFYKNIK